MASTQATAAGNFPAQATIRIGILSMAAEHGIFSVSSNAETTAQAAVPISVLLCKTHSVIREGNTRDFSRTIEMALDDSRSCEHE
jgi:hypothetical protein